MKSLLSISLLMLLLVACGDDDSPSGPQQGGDDAGYYPLAVGNQWVYQRYGSITTAGIQIATVSGMNITDITGTATHAMGIEVYVQEASISDTTEFASETLIVDSTFTTYMRLTDSGLYSYGSLAGTDSVSTVPFPLVEGATWQFSSNPPVTAEIVSLSASVFVPAGLYEDCLHLRTTWIESGNTLQNDTWFADGVGRIRNEYTQSYESYVTTVTSELLSSSLQ